MTKLGNKKTQTIPFDLKIFLLPDPANLTIQGKAEKGITIVLQEVEWQTPSYRQLLQKILQAVDLKLEKDVGLLPLRAHKPVSLTLLQQRVNALHHVLAFGCGPTTLGLQIDAPHYRPLAIGNCRIVFAAALARLHVDVAHKKALWRALKTFFITP